MILNYLIKLSLRLTRFLCELESKWKKHKLSKSNTGESHPGFIWEADSEGVWTFDEKNKPDAVLYFENWQPSEKQNVEKLWVWQNLDPKPLKGSGPKSMKVPREPYPEPSEENEKFMELFGQINVAIRHMQFGDILWMKIKSKEDTQTETAKLLASWIYNNRHQWKELLND